MNPFKILNVSLDDTEETIRKSYLTLVKQNTAERSPDKFRFIADAYELIKTERKKYEYLLFHNENFYDSPLDVMKNEILLPHNRKPLAFDKMKEFLKSCSK